MHSNIMSTPWPQDFFTPQEEPTQDQQSTTQPDTQDRYVTDPAHPFPPSSIPVPIDFNQSASRPFVTAQSSDFPRNAPPQLSPPTRFPPPPTYPFTFPNPLPFQQPPTLPPVRPDTGTSYYHPALPSPMDSRAAYGDRNMPFGSPSTLKGKPGSSSSNVGAPSNTVLMPSIHHPYGREQQTQQPIPLHLQSVASGSRSIVVEEDDWPPDNRVGRQRVMTKCPQCGHSNHIRRKICQKCQAPKPPPAKRKRRRKRKTLGAFRRAAATGVPGLPGNRMPLAMHFGSREAGDPRFMEHAESAYAPHQGGIRVGPSQPTAFVDQQQQHHPTSHMGDAVLGLGDGRQMVEPQTTPVPPLPQPGAFASAVSGTDTMGAAGRSSARDR